MIQPIYLYGSEVLRKVSEPFDLNDKEGLQALITDLWDTLKVADGCGLAAPQIGVGKRVFVVDGSGLTEDFPELAGFRRVFVNPVVIEESAKHCEYDEGCLSVPGIYASVRRPETIKVEFYDENLQKRIEEFGGFGCRMIQHEFSHLEGVLFTDLVAPIRKKMLTSKLLSISRGKVGTRYKAKIK